MKKLSVFALVIFLLSGISVKNTSASEPLKDYSFIRGVCYPGGWSGDQKIIERDLGYAKRLQINSTRIWLSYRGYNQDPKSYIEKLRNYVRTAYSFGITTMPVLFNGNDLNPATLTKEFRDTTANKYVKAIVDAIKNEPGLLIWDIMNEPSWNDYLLKSPPEEKQKRESEVNDFVRYYCSYVKKLDPRNAITVGHTFAADIPMAGDLVDVISFHDYLATRMKVENSYTEAEKFANKYNKPLINSELGCIGRANSYDMALEICESHKLGWYVFELMIQGYWSDIHGLVYPDGTIRDPSIIAAIYGFYRNRDLKTNIKPNPNKEGHVDKALEMLEKALKNEPTGFRNRRTSSDEILEAAEYCANLLEAAEMVPMYEPPTAKIKAWRSMPENERDIEAIRTFAYELGLTLKKYCKIL
jgi:tetratricopeptide (TPR) repeat protein